MLWRYGDTNPILCAVDSANVIEVGDMVYLSGAVGTGDDAIAASGYTWTVSIGATQDAFHNVFLGVAMQRSRSGDTDPIRIATTGVFEFDSAAATWLLGELVGPADSGSSTLEDQKVSEVADVARSIGRVVKATAASATKVLVAIESTVLTGGPQGQTASAG
jgi:hypothetical protein